MLRSEDKVSTDQSARKQLTVWLRLDQSGTLVWSTRNMCNSQNNIIRNLDCSHIYDWKLYKSSVCKQHSCCKCQSSLWKMPLDHCLGERTLRLTAMGHQDHIGKGGSSIILLVCFTAVQCPANSSKELVVRLIVPSLNWGWCEYHSKPHVT
jgi:hypothetical protein